MASTAMKINGVELVVYYEFTGHYIPATLEQPEEHPDLEVKGIFAADSEVDITELLSDWRLQEIEDKIWANE